MLLKVDPLFPQSLSFILTFDAVLHRIDLVCSDEMPSPITSNGRSSTASYTKTALK